MCICICILTSFLVRASHFRYEQASLEILQEIICSHLCLYIYLYNTLLFLTVQKIVEVQTGVTKFSQHNHKFWGYGYNNLCYNSHEKINFLNQSNAS